MMMAPLTAFTSACAAALLLTLSPLSGAPAARVVAIGDVHGAAEAFGAILARTGLVDAQQRWAGGRTVFVQTGDVTDRGPRTRDVLDLLMALEPQASKAGGKLHMIAGNHEFMNLLGDTRDVTPEIFLTFADDRSEARREKGFADARRLKIGAPAETDRAAWMAAHPPGFIEYRAAFAPNGRYGKWLRSKPVAMRLDDTIYMHAGIDPQWPAVSIDDINRRARDEMRAWDDAVRWMEQENMILPFSTLREVLTAAEAEYTRLAKLTEREPQDIRALQAMTAVINVGGMSLVAANGPLWYRGFNAWTDEEGAPQMAALLEKHKARRFVTGHSVQPDGRIRERFNGGLFLIDTGMVFPKGRASALEIAGGKTRMVYLDQ